MINRSQQIQTIFEKTKAVCFGRMIMQVPNDAVVVYGPAEIESSISYQEGGAGKIDEYVSQEMQEIEQQRDFLEKTDLAKLPLFGKIIDGPLPGQKIVVGSKDQVGYSVLSLVPIQDNLFIQEIPGGLPKYNFIDRMIQVAKLLRIRSESLIPADPGICIDGGFVVGTYQYERATIGIRLKEFPDVNLSIDVHKNLDFLNHGSNPKKLYEDAKENAKTAGLDAVFSRGRILRDQTRKIGGWTGQEMAFRTPEFKRSESVHEFRFHSVGSANDSFHPELDIRFDSGVKENAKGAMAPSLTDEEALDLWDRLISTIRLRDPSDATPVKGDKLPLDTQVSSGEVCPESGWWESSEKHVAHDIRKKFLRAGDAMPYVESSVLTGVWHKIFGRGRPKIASSWKLIAYEDEGPKALEIGAESGLSNRTDPTGVQDA